MRSRRQRPGPGGGRRTTVVPVSQLMAAELYQEGFGYFAARSDSTPARALWLALAGAFESRLGGPGQRRRSPSWTRPLASISGCRTTSGEPRWPGSPAPRLRGPHGDRRRRHVPVTG
jgi:hypothetical protein